MRPLVRTELENALKLEIRTAYSQEIRKEVETALVPEIEKRIANEYKAKQARALAAQKEQAEAALQAQLAVSKKELEERIRRDAEAKVARKLVKQTESEVRSRVEKMRQEVKAECEAEAQKHVEASLAQIKQERAEIGRLRSVENIRRTREEAAHKEAEAEFHKKVADFRRHVQEEEARIARMKALVQWKDEHVRRPASSLSNVPSPNFDPVAASRPRPRSHSPAPIATPSTAPSHAPPRHATLSSARNPSPKRNTPAPNISPIPNSTSTSPVGPKEMPEVTPSSLKSHASPSPQPISQKTQSPSPVYSRTSSELQAHSTPTKPAGLAFDFTFDVKLIAAKLISDARDFVQPQIKGSTEPPESLPTQPHPPPFPTSHVQASIPIHSPNRAPSPARTHGAHPTPEYSLGHIATEQRAQREFENQPVIPPPGTLGARLRVLLPRLYQLWDESEVSHVHRLDFCHGIRSLDVSSAERRVAMEISRLRKAFPSIQKEMALVARRESIKAQLARDESDKREKGLGAAERGQLQAELRRITTAVHAAITAWEAAHNTAFMYRAFPYRALLADTQ